MEINKIIQSSENRLKWKVNERNTNKRLCVFGKYQATIIEHQRKRHINNDLTNNDNKQILRRQRTSKHHHNHVCASGCI